VACGVLARGAQQVSRATADGGIVEKEHIYKDGDDTLTGYLMYKDLPEPQRRAAHTGTPKRPGLVVYVGPYGDGGGKNERDFARTYAEKGMVVFLPDYFPGRHSDEDPKQVQAAVEAYGPFLKDPAKAQRIALLALQQLTSLDMVDADKVGVVGFCFGGAMALNMARAGGKAKVAVSLHGEYPDRGDPTASYNVDYFVEMLGDSDPFIPVEARDAWIKELTDYTKDTNMNYDVEIWGNSVHAFSIKYSDAFNAVIAAVTGSVVDDTGVTGVVRYEPDRAAASFDRIDDLFAQHGLISAPAQCSEQSPTGATVTMMPTALPTTPPLTDALTSSLDGAAGVCPYMKEAVCFDSWLYVCEGCCTTGVNSQGSTCWDESFTSERCCKNAPKQEPLICPYLADPTCFDYMYPCKKCCETDLSITGGSCWDAVFTKSRCCSNTVATQIFTPPAFVPAGNLLPNFVPPVFNPAPVFAPPVFAPVFSPVFAPTTTGCVDSTFMCGIWAQLGECIGTTAGTQCPLSCGNCGRRALNRATALPDDMVDSRGKQLPFHNDNGVIVDSRGHAILMPADVQSDSGSVNVGLAAGLAVGGVCLVALVIAAVVYRRRNTKAATGKATVEMGTVAAAQ